MANRVIPEDIIVCILTLLPIRSIIRFKSVCKSWYHLFSTQNFIKSHHKQFSNNPKNHSFTILTTDKNDWSQAIYLLNTNDKKTINLEFPVHHKPWETRLPLDFVGCYNGLICISLPRYGGFVLWNPVMKLSKSFAKTQDYYLGTLDTVSLGFGYGDAEDDLKVVKITYVFCNITPTLVEVYSVNSDSWTTIDVNFYIKVLHEKNDAIVNGNPYWRASVRVDDLIGEGLVFFDVKKLVFEVVDLSTLVRMGGEIRFADWDGRIGALVCTKEDNEMVKSLDVWEVDDNCEEICRRNYSFGRIKVKVDRFLQCSEDGKEIVFERKGNLVVFDSHVGCFKKVCFHGAQHESFEVCGYTESLTCIEGMKQLEVKSEDDYFRI